jgi:hypothetical protein
MMEKRCHVCRSVKVLADFHADRRNTTDGRQAKCKACAKLIATARNRARGMKPQKYNDPNALGKCCTVCKQQKVIEFFPLDKRTSDGRGSECKACKTRLSTEKNRARGMRDLSQLLVDTTAPGRTCGKCGEWKLWDQFYNTSTANAPNGKMSKCKVCWSDACAQYRRENPEWVAGVHMLYRKSRRQSTPLWLTKAHKRAIYKLRNIARRLTLETGVQYHVDHIVPVMGKTVCGLTVPWNLRVISATENQSKSNKFDGGW